MNGYLVITDHYEVSVPSLVEESAPAVAIDARALPRRVRKDIQTRRAACPNPVYICLGELHQIPLPPGSTGYQAAESVLLRDGWKLVLGV